MTFEDLTTLEPELSRLKLLAREVQNRNPRSCPYRTWRVVFKPQLDRLVGRNVLGHAKDEALRSPTAYTLAHTIACMVCCRPADRVAARMRTTSVAILAAARMTVMVMAGKSPRQKGDRLERAIVLLLRAHGLEAKRVPLSGSARGYPGDVVVTLAGRDHVLECKSRKSLALYTWLVNRDALILKADRQEPLLVMRLADVLRVIEQGSTEPGGCHARRY